MVGFSKGEKDGFSRVGFSRVVVGLLVNVGFSTGDTDGFSNGAIDGLLSTTFVGFDVVS